MSIEKDIQSVARESEEVEKQIFTKEEIIKCPCGRNEYKENMIWKDGIQYCRACTYERWRKQSNGKWEPSENDKVFPEK